MTTVFANDAQRCPACGTTNHCAIAQGSEQCWCMAEPIGAPLPAANNASCYCRACLLNLSPVENSVQLQKPTIPR